jgi:hypothetical protein
MKAVNRMVIIAVFSLLLKSITSAQESNYLNSTFAVVSAVYAIQCQGCDKVSRDFQSIMKEDNVFSLEISGPNWLDAEKKDELSKYRIDFFLTSKLSKKPNGYEIEFVLYDKDKKTYPSDNFKHFISKDKLVNDIYDIAEMIVKEINDFKSKGQFKNVIQVVNFDIVMSAVPLDDDFAESFSKWLAYELKNDRIINVNYHVLSPDMENSKSENNLDGGFYQTGDESMEIKVKMEVNMDGKRVRCSTLTIDIIEYDNDKNRKEIIDEIIKKFKRIDPDNWN